MTAGNFPAGPATSHRQSRCKFPPGGPKDDPPSGTALIPALRSGCVPAAAGFVDRVAMSLSGGGVCAGSFNRFLEPVALLR